MTKNDLLEKIVLQKAVHSCFHSRTRVYAIISKIFMLFLPAVITFISISDFGNIGIDFILKNVTYSIPILTIISFLLFLLSIYIEIFSIDVKSKLHRNAINRLTKLKQEYKQELENKNTNESELTDKYRKLYIEVVESSPQFTDRQFRKGQKYYIQKIKMNAILEKQFEDAKRCEET